MAKIKFQTSCPGCGDKHFGVECKKPTRITSTVVNVYCDHCESSVLLRVTQPKDKTESNQINFSPIQIAASPKLLAIWQKDKEETETLAKAAKEVKPEESAASPNILLPIMDSDSSFLP